MEKKRHAARSADATGRTPNKRSKINWYRDESDQREDKLSTRKPVPKPVDLYEFKFPDRSSPNPPRSKGKDGHFRFSNGDNIGSRYKILNMIGEGTFGRVLECWDRHTSSHVAVKVIRSVPKYRDAAMIEQWFDYRGHICIVFQKLGMSLYDFMHKNAFRPFPLDIVQHFARQMLRAIVYMHSLSIVHTDLKPENILLTSSEHTKIDRDRYSRLGCRVPTNPDIRVIDFGSATFEEDRHSTVVSTRHYRAPEVILGLGWSYECDIWSAGCIIVELITGRALFQTHDNLEHLAMMERVIDRIPQDMVQNAAADAKRFFSKDDTLMWQSMASRKSIKAVQQLSPLRRLLRFEADPTATPHLDSLYSLLKEMLRFRPSERWSARSCLEHDFFRETIRSLLPRREDGEGHGRRTAPAEQTRRRMHSVSRDSRGTSESCPIICMSSCPTADERNGCGASAAAEQRGKNGNSKERANDQDRKDKADTCAEQDPVQARRAVNDVVVTVQFVGQKGNDAAVLASEPGAVLCDHGEVASKVVEGHSAVSLSTKAASIPRVSDSGGSLKHSGTLWHDTTVNQDNCLVQEAAGKILRCNGEKKLPPIGEIITVVKDDAPSTDVCEKLSWPRVF